MEVTLEADRIEWVADVAEARGNVRLQYGDQVLLGERATLRGDVVYVELGRYARPDGTLAFEVAEVGLQGRVARLEGVQATAGAATLDAAVVRVGPDAWDADDARLAPCACDDGRPPALSFRARRVVIVPDAYAVLHGGTVRVFGVPVLPVPYWRVPLDPRRFRLEFPQVGYGADGWAASVRGRGEVEGWRISGGPAWRQARGAWGEADAEGPGGELHGAAGWDVEEGRARGIVASRGGVVKPVRVAWDAVLPSDERYVSDYAVDYVARGVAWRDSRAVLGVGPTRADAWLPDDGSVAKNLRERVRYEFGTQPAVAPRVELAVVGTGTRGEAGADARVSATRGWLHGEARADAAAFTYFDGAVGGALAGEGRVELPVWSESGALRVQWWPGVRASGLYRRGEGPLVEDRTAEDAWVGPSLRAQAGVAQLAGGVGWTPGGWRPEVALDVDNGWFGLHGHADPALQAAEVRVAPEPLSFGLGGARTEGLWLGWGDAGLRAGRFLTGAGLTWDVHADAFAGADARMGYDDGCTSAVLSARIAPDRAVPDVGLAVVLRR